MSRYKHILLDADQTLFDFKTAENRAVKNVLNAFGLPGDDRTAQLYSEINGRFWKRLERGELTREQIYVGRFAELVDTLGANADPVEINNSYFSELPKCSVLFAGAREFLEQLKSSGRFCYLATNGAVKTQNARIDKLGVRGIFDGIYISEELGISKPSKEFFDYVLHDAGITDKSECIVVGDSPTADIMGGINAELDTCLYSPAGEVCTPVPTYIARNYDEILAIIE